MSGPPWTWNNSDLTTASATCFASDTNGHIIAGTRQGLYYSSQSTPGVWTLASGGFIGYAVNAVASTADGSAMFALTSNTPDIYYSTDHGQTWNVMGGSSPWASPPTSICCNGTWTGGGFVNIVLTVPVSGEGTTWQTRVQQNQTPSWTTGSLSGIPCSGVACNSTGTKYTLIANDGNYIYDSDGININAGSAIVWNPVSGTQRDWVSIACSGDGSTFIACNNEQEIWQSTELLGPWTQITNAPSNPYIYVATSVTGLNLYACYYSGGYVYSLNSGSTWDSDTRKNEVYAIYIKPDTGLPLLIGANISTDTYGIFHTASEPGPTPICFKEGSQILCLIDGVDKYIPIETMTPGTLVKTALNGYKPVALIGFSKLYNPGNGTKSIHHLVKCTPAKYPELTEDLVLTGAHSILVSDITDKQRADLTELAGRIFITDDKYRLMACLDDRSEPYEAEGLFTIWHFALEHTQYTWNYGVYANGLLVESTSLRMMKEFSGMTLLN